MEQAEQGRAAQTLTELAQLRRRTRVRAHGGAWLPAAAIAVLLLASSALYRWPFSKTYSISADSPYWAGLPDEQRSPLASYLFWFLGTPLLFAALGAWYRWRSRTSGLRVAWRFFAGTGIGVLLLLAVLAAVPKQVQGDTDAMTAPASPFWLPGLLTPLLPVAAAVVALGWVERSKGLMVIGGWIALLAVWLCCWYPMAYVPAWATRVLGGGPDVHQGQIDWRPGTWLVLMALPLIVFALVRGLRSRRATRAEVAAASGE